MFQKLLLPLDGTREAERAVPITRSVANALGAEVRLVDVLPSVNVNRDTIKCAFAYLDRIARHLAQTGVRVGTQVRTGCIADGVLSAVELVSADVLVLATSFDDVCAIAERARVPVLLVPPHAQSKSKIDRLLVPIDDSVGASVSLGVASELAQLTDADLVLLRVVKPAPDWYEWDTGVSLRQYVNPDWHSEALAGAERHVEGLVRQLEADDLDALARAAVGDLPDAIAEASEALDADLVVMGTDAYAGTLRTFTGSVARCLAEAAGVPVLLIPEASTSAPYQDLVGPFMHPVMGRSAVPGGG